MSGKILGNPDNLSEFDRTKTAAFNVPPGRKVQIRIEFSSPLWENTGAVFNEIGSNVMTKANLHYGPRRVFQDFGPWTNAQTLIAVACHKDGAWDVDDQPFHQSLYMYEFSRTTDRLEVGWSDSGTVNGDFRDAHVQITISLV